MDTMFMILKNKLTPGVMYRSYIYEHSQISGERLQDHWSSGLNIFLNFALDKGSFE